MKTSYASYKKHYLAALLSTSLLAGIAEPCAAQEQPQVILETSLGEIVLELYPDKAPRTVENFLAYVESGHYDGTIFYRVTDFSIQAGSMNPDLTRRPSRAPILNEANNGLLNQRGSLAMARYEPHTAAAEFYINLKSNGWLDHSAETEAGWGYCVFGQVISGLETVERIAAVKTESRQALADIPVDDVRIARACVASTAGDALSGCRQDAGSTADNEADN